MGQFYEGKGPFIRCLRNGPIQTNLSGQLTFLAFCSQQIDYANCSPIGWPEGSFPFPVVDYSSFAQYRSAETSGSVSVSILNATN